MKKVLMVALVLLCMACAYVIVIVFDNPVLSAQDDSADSAWLVVEEQGELAPLSPVTSQSVTVLARAFGAAVPGVPNALVLSGEVRQEQYAGGRAYVLSLSMRGNDGEFSLVCVRPAAASALLLRDDCMLQNVTVPAVAGMQAVYASTDDRRCMYFADKTVACRLYAQDMGETEFLRLCVTLTEQ